MFYPGQSSILKTQRMCLQGKGGGIGPWRWNMQDIRICNSQGAAHLGPTLCSATTTRVSLSREVERELSLIWVPVQNQNLHSGGPKYVQRLRHSALLDEANQENC